MKHKMFKVKKRTLLLIAGIVWLVAGFNVARLGILSYLEIEQKWYWYLLSVVIFALCMRNDTAARSGCENGGYRYGRK